MSNRALLPYRPEISLNVKVFQLAFSKAPEFDSTLTVFLAESSRGLRVNAVTLAHEFGHMLGVQHVGKKENIMNQRSLKELQTRMAASPAGRDHMQSLDEEQILDARAQAQLDPYPSSLG